MSKTTDKYGELPPAHKPGDIKLTSEELNVELAKFTAQRDRALGQLNGTEQSLCTQLMLINTVLITVSVLILSNVIQSTHFSTWDKWNTIIAFVMLVASTLAGIKYYFEIMRLHRKWADVKHSITYFIAFGHYTHQKQMREDIVQRQESIAGDTNKRYLYAQIGCMSIALLAYSVVIILLVFSGKNG